MPTPNEDYDFPVGYGVFTISGILLILALAMIMGYIDVGHHNQEKELAQLRGQVAVLEVLLGVHNEVGEEQSDGTAPVRAKRPARPPRAQPRLHGPFAGVRKPASTEARYVCRRARPDLTGDITGNEGPR